jgi:electron transport complex protein RnfA
VNNVIADILTLSFALIFSNNIIFGESLGAGTLFTMSGKKQYLRGFCLSALYLMTIGTALSYFADLLFANALYSRYFRPIAFILVIGIVYVITLLLLWKFAGNRFDHMKRYIHVSAFNSAVLGSMLLASQSLRGGYFDLGASFVGYLFFGLFSGLGFCLAALICSFVYGRLHSEKIPEIFRGYPAMLVFIGFISMALYGL